MSRLMETPPPAARVLCIQVPRPEVAALSRRLGDADVELVRRPISSGLRDPRPVSAIWVDGRNWLDLVALHARFPGIPLLVRELPQTDDNPVAVALLAEIDLRPAPTVPRAAQVLAACTAPDRVA